MIIFYCRLKARGRNSTCLRIPMPNCILFGREIRIVSNLYITQELTIIRGVLCHNPGVQCSVCTLVPTLHCTNVRVYDIGILHVVHRIRTDILSTCSHACTIECVSTHGINVLSKLGVFIKLTIRYLGVFNHELVAECWRDGTQQGQSMSGTQMQTGKHAASKQQALPRMSQSWK